MKRKNMTRNALFTSIISLLLCVSMLVGTTFAWFTDEVVTGMNTIAAGNLDVELLADGAEVDSTTKLFDDVDLWEPGVVVYENIQVANVGTLALKYQMTLNFRDVNDLNGHKLSEVVKVAVIDKVESGATRAEVLAEAKANGVSLTNFYLTGELEAGESATEQAIVVYWEPNDNATDNLYNANNGQVTSDGNPLSIEFGINLQATQKMSEEDSFGNDYDEFASILPKAQVIDQGAKTVSATAFGGSEVLEYSVPFVLQFQPNETYEEAQSSAYRYWHADYVVKADKDVPADSMALIGYYKAYCDTYNNGNWVAMTNEGTAITAGTEIRLVQLLGATVNYEEICNFGNDGTGFLCTATDLTGENVGTTLTVELRLYETTGDPTTTTGSKNEETGNYEVVGTYTYTFGAKEVASATELQAALTSGASKITLTEDVQLTEKLNITSDVVIDGNGKTLSYTGSARAIEIPNNADYDVDVTIKNLTVDCSNSYCQRGINYNDNGTLTLDNVTVKGDNVTYGINLPGKSTGATVIINGGSYSANIALNVWGANSVVTANNVELITVDNTESEGYAVVKLNNDGTISAEGAVITINGGSITVTGSYCDDSYAVTNATSTGVINIGSTTTVTGEIKEGYVSVVRYTNTDNFYSHTSLQNSVKCVEETNSGWVELLTDIYVDSLEVNCDVTIKTNGHNLTVGSYTGTGKLTVDGNVAYCCVDTAAELATAVAAGGTVVLNDNIEVTEVLQISEDTVINGNGNTLTTSGTRAFRVTTSDVDVTLNNVKIETSAVGAYNADARGISIDGNLNAVTVTLNNCTVDFADGAAADWAYGVNISGSTTNSTIIINGGYYEGANVINIWGTGNTVIIDGATLNCTYGDNASYHGAGIRLNSGCSADITVKNTTISGTNAVAFCACGVTEGTYTYTAENITGITTVD